MSSDDAARWNYRYSFEPGYHTKSAHSLLENHLTLLPKSGIALDIATGLGRDAEILEKQGLIVFGIDASITGLQKAKRMCSNLRLIVADLEAYPLPEIYFDVILNFYYFQPDLIPSMCKHIKPGGILFFETFTTPMLEIKPTLNQAHLVNPKEFLHFFSDFDVLYYYDGWCIENSNKDKCHVQLIARKVK